MRNVLLKSGWMAAALAVVLWTVADARAYNQPRGRNRGGGNDNGGGGNNNNNNNNKGGGNKPGGGGGTIINNAPGNLLPGGGNNKGGNNPANNNNNKGNTNNPRKLIPGAGQNLPGGGQNIPGAGGGFNKKGPDKSKWNNVTKDGWHKGNWNNNFNSQHQQHRHGYWNNGIWIAPWIILNNRPWVYMQPVQPIVSGQKWLGVTYEPYDGGGAYVTGIYEGSPAQQIGLEVGDVIVSLDGVDATQLGSAIQGSDGNVVLQVLSGRNGGLVEIPVNLIR